MTSSDRHPINEQDILDSMEYLNSVVDEFGILHPLAKECISELINLIEQFASTNFFSKDTEIILTRFFKRLAARQEKALEQAKLENDKTNLKKIGFVVGGLALAAGAAFLWSRSKKPTEIFHHLDGHISEQISHHHSGTVTKNLNVNWPLSWH